MPEVPVWVWVLVFLVLFFGIHYAVGAIRGEEKENQDQNKIEDGKWT